MIYDDRIYLSIFNIRLYLNMGNVTFSLCPCSRENLMIDHHFFWYPIFRLTHMNFRGFASGLFFALLNSGTPLSRALLLAIVEKNF